MTIAFDETIDGVRRVLTSKIGVTGKLSPKIDGEKTFGPVSILLMVLAGGGATGGAGLSLLESSAMTMATANASELSKRADAVGSIDVLHVEVAALQKAQTTLSDAVQGIRRDQREDFRALAELIRGMEHD